MHPFSIHQSVKEFRNVPIFMWTGIHIILALYFLNALLRHPGKLNILNIYKHAFLTTRKNDGPFILCNLISCRTPIITCGNTIVDHLINLLTTYWIMTTLLNVFNYTGDSMGGTAEHPIRADLIEWLEDANILNMQHSIAESQNQLDSGYKHGKGHITHYMDWHGPAIVTEWRRRNGEVVKSDWRDAVKQMGKDWREHIRKVKYRWAGGDIADLVDTSTDDRDPKAASSTVVPSSITAEGTPATTEKDHTVN